MKKLIPVLALWLPTVSQAQLYPPNEAGVTFGQFHTIVRDVEATKKFWILFGGKPIKIDDTEAIKFPGAFIFLTPGTPTGGSVGTPVNHVGFGVQSVVSLLDTLTAAGVKIFRVNKSPLNGQDVAHLYTADDLELEITEEAGVDPYPLLPPGRAIESNHIHFSVPPVPQSSRRDMQDYYVKMLGVKALTLGPEIGGAVPGMGFMRFGFPSKTLGPTKGRAIDHIGFEVRNLAEYCQKLEAKGVKFDEPYSKSRHKSFASAQFTDPWGTSIELTEGLNRF